MNVTDYTYLINKPDLIQEKQTEALAKVLDEFPYFQSARAIRLKGLYNQNSFRYNTALKTTAAYTTDRSILFDFITSDTFTALDKNVYERKALEILDIYVHDSKILVPEEKPVIKINKLEQSILTSIKEASSAEIKEIENTKIEELTRILDHINLLDKEGLKQLYKTQMREGRLSEKGGAGLGFIDIARKTGRKLDFHFLSIDEENSFFILTSTISRTE